MNFKLSFSQGLLALQTFSMMLMINAKSESGLEFSYYSGLIILIPTSVVLSKIFLIEPTLIFEDKIDENAILNKEKCMTLLLLCIFSTFLFFGWTLLFKSYSSSTVILLLLFFTSNLGEGMKLFLLNFSRHVYIAKMNTFLILISVSLQQFFTSNSRSLLILFYLQSFPFFVLFLRNIFSCRRDKITIDSARFRETFLQSVEGTLSFLELFIFMWILRTTSQLEALISFQQSIMLITPLNSIANLLSIGLYARLLTSGETFVRTLFKWSLIGTSLIYLAAVMFDPLGIIGHLINHGEPSDIREWFSAQIIASCFSLFIADKYYELKAKKNGRSLLGARIFQVILVSTILVSLVFSENEDFLIKGFLVGMFLSSANWIRVYRKSI